MAWLERFGWLIGPKNTEAKIVVIGLVNSGKTTIMRQLKPRHVSMTELTPNIPILGLHGEQFSYKSLTFTAFDLGDTDGIGNPWEDNYRTCHGIIFVVDSLDRMTMPLAKLHLNSVLENRDLERRESIPLLVLANKWDHAGAMSSVQLGEMLEIGKRMLVRPLQVFCCDGLTGEGFNEALDWLAFNMKPVCCRVRKSCLKQRSLPANDLHG